MQIFITDWWLCPELYLRRPFHVHGSSRLDSMLEAKAKEGVQVFSAQGHGPYHFISTMVIWFYLQLICLKLLMFYTQHNFLDIVFVGYPMILLPFFFCC